MVSIISILQIVVAVILITLVLLQQGEGGLGSTFGQGGGSYSTRRGLQKHAFTGTIISGILFILLALLNLIL